MGADRCKIERLDSGYRVTVESAGIALFGHVLRRSRTHDYFVGYDKKVRLFPSMGIVSERTAKRVAALVETERRGHQVGIEQGIAL